VLTFARQNPGRLNIGCNNIGSTQHLASELFKSIAGIEAQVVPFKSISGLLTALRYVKDNRLLPRGFDPAAAPPEIAVQGDAAADPTFTGGSDRVRYRVAGLARVDRSVRGSLRLEAVLHYQPIAWRWARNLAVYDAPETRRFVGFYDAAAAESAMVLARANVAVDIN
jgi:hypothetical protein